MNIEIDRLTLRVPGLAAPDATRLAMLVGERLALASMPTSGGAFDNLRVALPGRSGESLEALAQRIVEQLLGAVR